MFNLDDLFAEPNEFRVCDKCKATNLNTLLPRLKAIDPKAKNLSRMPVILWTRS